MVRKILTQERQIYVKHGRPMLKSSIVINNAKVVQQMDRQTHRQTNRQTYMTTIICPQVCGDIRYGAQILARDHNTN